MKGYRAKRKRHVCSMKGCRNREVILCTKNGELGGGLYLCRECIEGLTKFIPMFDEKKPEVSGKEVARDVIEDVKKNITEVPMMEATELTKKQDANSEVRKKANKAGK